MRALRRPFCFSDQSPSNLGLSQRTRFGAVASTLLSAPSLTLDTPDRILPGASSFARPPFSRRYPSRLPSAMSAACSGRLPETLRGRSQASLRTSFRAGTRATPSWVQTLEQRDTASTARRARSSRSIDWQSRPTTRPAGTPHGGRARSA